MKNVYKDLLMDFGLSCWIILKINCLHNIDLELFEKINFLILAFWSMGILIDRHDDWSIGTIGIEIVDNLRNWNIKEKGDM